MPVERPLTLVGVHAGRKASGGWEVAGTRGQRFAWTTGNKLKNRLAKEEERECPRRPGGCLDLPLFMWPGTGQECAKCLWKTRVGFILGDATERHIQKEKQRGVIRYSDRNGCD
jgi:hypothetical protein